MTDKNGVASTRPRAGSQAGVVTVEAVVTRDDGTPTNSATFRLIVLERRDGPTGFSGLVLDHSGVPVAGVTLSIGRTSLVAHSDNQGRFAFDDGVPAGKVDVMVDGRDVQVTRGSQSLEYPGLHFAASIVQGQMNQLPHPIYLPSIDRSRDMIVGGDTDVILTLPGVEEFQMRVFANSVTLPDGSRVGPIVVTHVNGDRLPMVPPGGFASFGAVAWTVQPSGTRFDPPIQVTIPNTTGMKPGETNEIVQWDHDLANFVPMGRATVSEDGTRLITDQGSGISKAGWGGGPPPVPTNEGEHQCSARTLSTTPTLLISANGEFSSLFLPPDASGSTNVSFAAFPESCSSPSTISWVLGDGATSSAMSFSHAYAATGDFNVSATVSCGCGHSATAEIRVVVAKVDFKQAATCSGFDEDFTPPWIMVPRFGTNTSIATIAPASAATDIEFKPTSSSIATALPTSAIATPQTVTVSGITTGNTDIEAKNGTSMAFGLLKVEVKNRINKTVEIHAITEQNDDVQTHPVGYFPQNQVCVTRGPNGTLDTTLVGDDGITSTPSTGDFIHTGPNGICDSTAAVDDLQVIPVGQRLGFTVCVSDGTNGFLDTANTSGDDVLGANDINAGPDGICDSRANNIDLVPLDVPSATALQAYLNDIAWGKQANVHFTVTRSDHSVNYDLDRDTKLNDPLDIDYNEVNAITVAAKNAGVNFNVYYTKNYSHPVALADDLRGESWFGDLKNASVLIISAHEIGHLMNRLLHSTSANPVLDLMNVAIDRDAGCRITKHDWHHVNP